MKSEKRETDLKERLEVIGQMEVLDMHTHLVSLSEKQKRKRSLLFEKQKGLLPASVQEHPRNGNLCRNFRNGPEILASFGIHPWYAGQYLPEHEMEATVPVILSGDRHGQCMVPGAGIRAEECFLPDSWKSQKNFTNRASSYKRNGTGDCQNAGRLFTAVCIHWYSGTEAIWKSIWERDTFLL